MTVGSSRFTRADIRLETWLTQPGGIHREFFRFWDQFWNPAARLGDLELPDLGDFGGGFPLNLDPCINKR